MEESKEEIIDIKESNEPVSEQQINTIYQMFSEKNFSPERIKKAFDYYEVNNAYELNNKTAQEFISQLGRVQ